MKWRDYPIFAFLYALFTYLLHLLYTLPNVTLLHTSVKLQVLSAHACDMKIRLMRHSRWCAYRHHLWCAIIRVWSFITPTLGLWPLYNVMPHPRHKKLFTPLVGTLQNVLAFSSHWLEHYRTCWNIPDSYSVWRLWKLSRSSSLLGLGGGQTERSGIKSVWIVSSWVHSIYYDQLSV